MIDLFALAVFASRLTEPGASFGKMTTTIDAEGDGEVAAWPYWEPSPLAEEFIEMAYDTGWVRGNFDWSRWTGTSEGQRYLTDPSSIAATTSRQLQKIITALLRSEKFCEGAMLQAFESGIISAIAARAANLGRKRSR